MIRSPVGDGSFLVSFSYFYEEFISLKVTLNGQNGQLSYYLINNNNDVIYDIN